MAIGYACIALGLDNSSMRGCTIKNASSDRLDQLTSTNLQTLSRILDYNAAHGIKLFRISSNIIPFGSHPINQNKWWMIHAEALHKLGERIKCDSIRVSMHPGQYTVLNALDQQTVERAVADLEYHARFLDALGIDTQNKIILHVGGVYGDHQKSLSRFRQNVEILSPQVMRRLVIENDEKYHIGQVLKVTRDIKIPAVLDVFHHQVNPAPGNENIYYWLDQCQDTWHEGDGLQKIHYSQQEQGLRTGAHARSIELQPFLDFYDRLPDRPLDIMLECKDKDISAIKCQLAVDSRIIG